MTAVFQPNVFQHPALFQTAGDCKPSSWGASWGMSWGESWGCQEVPPTPTPTVGQQPAGRSKGGKRRRWLQVQIDGEVFTVRSEAEALALLAQAREIAREAAANVPVQRRQPLSAPKMRIVAPDYGDAAVQQLQAQVEATRAAIIAIYAQAAQDAKLRRAVERDRMMREADDEEAILLLL